MSVPAVHIEPLPEWTKKVRPWLWPDHPPVHAVTRDEIELALELISELDPESRNWYASTEARLREKLEQLEPK